MERRLRRFRPPRFDTLRAAAYNRPNLRTGESIQQPPSREVDACGGPKATAYYASDPTEIRLSVSAVVWRGDRGGEMLLMQRSDNGQWGLPGGYVERGESVLDATAREVLEETGVVVAVDRLVGVYSDPARQVIAYPDGGRVQAVNLCFEARPVGEGEATTPGGDPRHRLLRGGGAPPAAGPDPPGAHRRRAGRAFRGRHPLSPRPSQESP